MLVYTLSFIISVFTPGLHGHAKDQTPPDRTWHLVTQSIHRLGRVVLQGPENGHVPREDGNDDLAQRVPQRRAQSSEARQHGAGQADGGEIATRWEEVGRVRYCEGNARNGARVLYLHSQYVSGRTILQGQASRVASRRI